MIEYYRPRLVTRFPVCQNANLLADFGDIYLMRRSFVVSRSFLLSCRLQQHEEAEQRKFHQSNQPVSGEAQRRMFVAC